MKYIRTKDTVSEQISFTINDQKLYGTVGKERLYNESEIIKKSDVLEDLFDEIIIKHPMPNEKPWIMNFGSIKVAVEYLTDRIPYTLTPDTIVCGAIWIDGKNNEPILKSVAKMKGVNANGNIDWELL